MQLEYEHVMWSGEINVNSADPLDTSFIVSNQKDDHMVWKHAYVYTLLQN